MVLTFVWFYFNIFSVGINKKRLWALAGIAPVVMSMSACGMGGTPPTTDEASRVLRVYPTQGYIDGITTENGQVECGESYTILRLVPDGTINYGGALYTTKWNDTTVEISSVEGFNAISAGYAISELGLRVPFTTRGYEMTPGARHTLLDAKADFVPLMNGARVAGVILCAVGA